MADLVAVGDRTTMTSVYIIKSLSHNYRYVGITDNLERRLFQHNHGRSKATKGFAPFVLLNVEQFPNKKETRIREKFLKSGIGRKFLDNLVS